MNKPVGDLMPESEIGAPAVAVTGLALLRAPFPPNQISKRPKETKAQKEERERDRSKGVSCQVCGGWHHRSTIHLDYVGHAALMCDCIETINAKLAPDHYLNCTMSFRPGEVERPRARGRPTRPDGVPRDRSGERHMRPANDNTPRRTLLGEILILAVIVLIVAPLIAVRA